MAEKSINERIVYFLGSASFDKELEMGQDIILRVSGNVLKVEESDNQDGTLDRTFKVKIVTIESEE